MVKTPSVLAIRASWVSEIMSIKDGNVKRMQLKEGNCTVVLLGNGITKMTLFYLKKYIDKLILLSNSISTTSSGESVVGGRHFAIEYKFRLYY